MLPITNVAGSPPVRLIRQRLNAAEVPRFEETLAELVRARLAKSPLPKGARIAIGVGSRGISPIGSVVRTLVRELRAAGAEPFIVPAMGSHGGGTANGQAAVLSGYGIDEAHMQVPVRATMETVQLGTTPTGVHVHLDAFAAGADGIVVIGRVKPHTGFRGPIESGLCKMLVVGLGKRRGAESIHAHPLAESIPTAAELALAQAPVLFGVAVVENGFDRPHTVEVVAPTAFLETDRRLLTIARDVFPRVPVQNLDVLLIDRIGKNISGTGMDPNVVGMWRRLPELPHNPDYTWIAALGLTPESHGNAAGVGMADLVSRKLADAMDTEVTATNVLTSMALGIGKLPLVRASDRACYETALALAARSASGPPRVGRIANTLTLETFWISENVMDDLPGTCEVVASASTFGFDERGAIAEPNAFRPLT